LKENHQLFGVHHVELRMAYCTQVINLEENLPVVSHVDDFSELLPVSVDIFVTLELSIKHESLIISKGKLLQPVEAIAVF